MAKQNFYIRVRRRNPKLKIMQDYKKKISGTVEDYDGIEIGFAKEHGEWFSYEISTGMAVIRTDTMRENKASVLMSLERIQLELKRGREKEIEKFLPGALDRLEEWNDD